MDCFERFRSGYPFPLDDFQVEAIRAIEGGQSVIVSAPTGAGKTLVAEFAIHAALAAGRRLAYTTPLKALSNQKFADFTRAFGADAVGILTGDVKVNPHARILVMTTEILRNALYGSGLDDLRYIVLDECHYMGDEGRGTVWEEIIVSAPSDVVLVGLSATVANVKEIADWISIVHRPILPIYHPHRPVPVRMEDREDRPMDDRDPVGDLLDVGDGRRETHEHDVAGGADDDLLPDRAAPFVAHVVALVEHDVSEVVEAAPVERVAENLGGHDENAGVRVDLDVAGEDPDRVRAERTGEIGELLIRERLERRRVR